MINDRLGRVVEDVGDAVPPDNGDDVQLSLDERIQSVAYEKIRDAVVENKARAGSCVVVDATTGELLAMANYPSFNPNDRGDRSGERLRNRAMTDVFEPGSTMKPITVATALQLGRVTPQTIIDTNPGRITVAGATVHDDENFGVLNVIGVIQKSSNVGATKISQRMTPHEMWDSFTSLRFPQKPQTEIPRRHHRAPAAQEVLAADRAGHHVLRLRPVRLPVPDCACLHRLRARRRGDPGEAGST